jgi:hypothetical protein
LAIPSLFGKPSNPINPLEPLQRERSLRNIEKSGWRDSNRPLQIGAKEKPIPDEGDGASMSGRVILKKA